MSFAEQFSSYNWNEVKQRILDATAFDVQQALTATRRGLDDFAALLSPAAAPFLEDMAQLSQALTRKRFGNVIQMYVPMYVSNECQNICTYCGFSFNNKIARTTLNDEQIRAEVRAIKAHGYEHVLIVSGEARNIVDVDYFERVLKLLRPSFANLSMEVQPLDEDEYRRLAACGLHSVLVYQETYHEENYKKHHPKGRKSNFLYRLETPDRLGRAGIHKIGLGALLGLEDWRTDSWFVASHLSYLSKQYWQTKFSISFPRLRPASGVVTPAGFMTDRELVQLICAYRLFDENVELSLSTRESAQFRDYLVALGITAMSAGSSTEPGGYSTPRKALAQFEISDERSPAEVVAAIRGKGYEAVWKDWDRAFT